MADSIEEVKKAKKLYLFIGTLLFVFTVVTVMVASVEWLDFGGHGFDAIEELGGYYIMIAMRLEYDEQHTRNDDTSTSKTKAMFPVSDTSSVFRQIAIIADPLEKTSLIPATNVSYRGPAYTAPAADAWGTTNETTFDVESGSGKVLYTENRQPVSRAIDQIEDIKVVFEF